MSIAITVLLVLFVVAGIGIVWLVDRFNRKRPAHPACGRCGYNLTGSTANRCPECGGLFIDVGVVTARRPSSSSRSWIAPLLIGTLGFILLMAGISIALYLNARAQQAAALAARAQAAAAQQRAQAIASFSANLLSTSRPATTTAPANQYTSK